MIAQGWGAPPWADENALKLDAQSLKHNKPEIVYFKRVNVQYVSPISKVF